MIDIESIIPTPKEVQEQMYSEHDDDLRDQAAESDLDEDMS